MIAIFAPEIFGVMIHGARTTTLKDLQPVVFTFLKVVGGMGVLATGNIFVWGGLYWIYRNTAYTQHT